MEVSLLVPGSESVQLARVLELQLGYLKYTDQNLQQPALPLMCRSNNEPW